MPKIFISHASSNNREARALRDWLADNGWDDLFLDFDPESGIRPGGRWETALHENVDLCEAVIFLISCDWLQRDWCVKELELADKLGVKHLFGVVIERNVSDEMVPGLLKRDWQYVNLATGRDHELIHVISEDLTDDGHVTFSRSNLDRLRFGLIDAGISGEHFNWPPESDPDRSPYPGLRPLEAQDAGVFFGREADIFRAMDELRTLHESGGCKLYAIVGASGAGKSSFMRAGLLPRLQRDSRRFNVLPPIRPALGAILGEEGLVAGIAGAGLKAGLGADFTRDAVRKTIDSGPPAFQALAAKLCPRGQGQSVPRTLVIPVDQGEELFQHKDASDQVKRLLSLISGSLAQPTGQLDILFLLAIKSQDFALLQSGLEMRSDGTGMRDAGRIHAYPLGPLSQGNFRDVIVRPAETLTRNSVTRRSLTLEPDFVEALLQDLMRDGGTDGLPLLAFVLERMYRDYGDDDLITLDEYKESGRIEGAIESVAKNAVAEIMRTDPSLSNAEKALARVRDALIPALVVVDPDTLSPESRLADATALGENGAIVDILAAHRLITIDHNAAVGTAQIAHEALLRQWRPLQEWLAEDREAIADIRRANREANEWERSGREQSRLLQSGDMLTQTMRSAVLPRLSTLVAGSTTDYLENCRKAYRARKLAEKKHVEDANARAAAEKNSAANARRLSWFGFAAAFIFFVFAGVLAYSLWQMSLSENKAIEAQSVAQAQSTAAVRNESISLAALAQIASVDGQQADAVKLALAAWPRKGDESRPQIRRTWAIFSEVLPRMKERERLRHKDAIRSATYSPDGSRVVTVSNDNAARLWDAATGEPIGEPMRHSDMIWTAVFSPDGGRIATASSDKTAQLWDSKTGASIGNPMRHEGAVVSAVFSIDGTRLVTASSDKTARLWNTTTSMPIGDPLLHKTPIYFADISIDGTRVVTASPDGAALWNVDMSTPSMNLLAGGYFVRSAVFSPDGIQIVTVSGVSGVSGGQNIARLWDVKTGSAIGNLMRHDDWVISAVFSPDGTRLATASRDKSARLWDARNGDPIGQPMRHEDVVKSVSFSPDGNRVATASYDNTAHLWNAATGIGIGGPMHHADEVNSVAFSPDGARVVTASSDNTARLWDATTGVAIGEPMRTKRLVTGSVFSPDGEHIGIASVDGTISLWDAAARNVWKSATREAISDPLLQDNEIESVFFSSDNTRLLTASKDQTARQWNAATGAAIGIPMRHENPVGYAAFSPDGTLLVTATGDFLNSDEGVAQLWGASSSAKLGEPMRHAGAVLFVAFSPDGKRIVTASADFTAQQWDVVEQAPIGEPMLHRDRVNTVTYSFDGERIVTTSADHMVRIWKAATQTELGEPLNLDGVALSARFSPDGLRLATGSSQGTIQIWDSASHVELFSRKFPSSVPSVDFSPDGKKLLIATDNYSQIFDLSNLETGNAFEIACKRLGNNTDLSDVIAKYGLGELTPICGENAPMPLDWSKLE